MPELFGIPLTGQNIAFFFLALIILLSGVTLLMLDKVMHMAVALGGVFLGVAGIFILLGADFVGVVQIMIYAGAITILMLFALMLTQTGDDAPTPHPHVWRAVLTLLGAAGFVAVVLYVVRTLQWPVDQLAVQPFSQPTVNLIAQLMFHTYTLPFELVSLLLTAALVGAVVIARRED